MHTIIQEHIFISPCTILRALLIILVITAGCRPAPGDQDPNIILILADDLGYNDLSCYRDMHPRQSERPPTSRTPHIDNLAEEGMLFTDFYCGAAVCSPSRAALLTGRNATRVGIYNWIPPGTPMHLRNEEVTIAEVLRAAGYRTAHFGKWHLTSKGMGQPLPTDQGFGEAFFTYNNASPSHYNPVDFFRDGEEVGALKGYSCQLVVDQVIAWLASHQQSRVPFYINVWFNEPHEKVAAPEEMTSRHTYNKAYYGCIENMDREVGRLTSFLKENELEENTMVIFSSDNGSQMVASNDPLRGEKAFNYEGGIRVPFLIKWPGSVPRGEISGVNGSFTDILPTLASLTGSPVPAERQLDGEDLSAVFRGSELHRERSSPVFFFRYFHDPICMLREGKWVLLGYHHEPIPVLEDYNQSELALLKPGPDQPRWSMWSFRPEHMDYLKDLEPVHFELYDIEKDLEQEHDLSAGYPGIVSRMKEKMVALRDEMVREGGDWYPQQ